MTRDWTAARAKVDAEGRCRVCGERDGLQAAHVIPRSLGGGDSADSTVPLCQGCHFAYDAGLRDLLPALTRDEQAEAVRVRGIIGALQRISPGFNPRSVVK